MSRAEDLIQRGLNKFPGYKGYRDKEDRRDEDKRVRTAIADRIAAMVDKLTAYNATLSAERQFDSLSALEGEVGQIRMLSDRIRHASYGYGGIFTDRSVDAGALEQLRLFDAALSRDLDGLDSAIGTLTGTTPPDSAALAAVTQERNRLTTLFDGRTSVIDEGRATEDSETVALLAIPEKIDPSPLLSLSKGDALSVLGDNYIANGVINLKTSAGEIVLARVSTDTTGATWLLGSSISGVTSAKLVEGETSSTEAAAMSSATASINTEQGIQDDIAARYSYQELGDNRVVFTLALGDSIVSYSGTTVNDKDIEVYSVS